jgi:hypothetical protein
MSRFHAYAPSVSHMHEWLSELVLDVILFGIAEPCNFVASIMKFGFYRCGKKIARLSKVRREATATTWLTTPYFLHETRLSPATPCEEHMRQEAVGQVYIGSRRRRVARASISVSL